MGQALGWRDLVDGGHGHRLDRHSGLGGGPSGPPAAGLAASGATLYVAIAATAVVVIIVPVSAGPVRQEPTLFTLFFGEVTLLIAAAVAKMGGNLVPAQGIN